MSFHHSCPISIALQEKPETKIKTREPVVNAPVTQPKKQKSQQPKKQSGKSKGSATGGKPVNPVARQMKRKKRSDFEKITETVKEYPIIVATAIIVLCAAIIYTLV